MGKRIVFNKNEKDTRLLAVMIAELTRKGINYEVNSDDISYELFVMGALI